MPFIPHTEEDVREMLAAIGVDDIEALYDEIDTVFGPKARENEEIRGLLNAGQRRGATAGRCVIRGKNVEIEELRGGGEEFVGASAAFAGIGAAGSAGGVAGGRGFAAVVAAGGERNEGEGEGECGSGQSVSWP